MTIAELKNNFEVKLKGLYSSEEIKNFFYYTLSHLLKVPKLVILSHFDKKIDENILDELDHILLKLIKKVPIQYILGKTDFYGMVLNVNPSVLIPRPETEELVDWIIQENKDKKVKILDVCTGSGCIALALKKNIPTASVSALDISAKALEVAKGNANEQSLDVRFIETDALNLIGSVDPSDFDIIVSNPPYILNGEQKDMQDNVLLYEPHNALFVPDNTPLIFYKAIAQFAAKSNKKLDLYFEINETMAAQLSALLKGMGLTDIVVRKDINDKDRMLKCAYIC